MAFVHKQPVHAQLLNGVFAGDLPLGGVGGILDLDLPLQIVGGVEGFVHELLDVVFVNPC